MNRFKTILFIVVGLLLGLIFTLVPLIGENPSVFLPYIKDGFVRGNLQSPVSWDGFEKWIGVVWSAMIIYSVWGKNGLTFRKFLLGMTLVTCLIFIYSRYVVHKIEGYTQATPIDFYIAKMGQKVYVETVGFKSFAHLLYFQKKAGSPTGEELLNRSLVDRPSFFVMKSDVEDRFKYHPNLILINEENGFLFYKHK